MLKISINKQDGKIQEIPAINTSPLTNKYCMKNVHKKTICKYCYAIRALYTYRKKYCPENYHYNGIILSSSIIQDYKIPYLNYFQFRFNAFGELINEKHLINICNITKKNPHCSFSLYSKRYEIIEKYNSIIPDNLTLLYSSPIINKLEIKKYFHKSYTIYTKDYAEKNDIKINCKGKCFQCLKCYKRKGENISGIMKENYTIPLKNYLTN